MTQSTTISDKENLRNSPTSNIVESKGKEDKGRPLALDCLPKISKDTNRKFEDAYSPLKSKDLIPFNEWSRERIKQGRKFCTSRHRRYSKDPRVTLIERLSWGFIKRYLWKREGADSPDELQKVIDKIYGRKVTDYEMLYVHFGDFR